MEEQDRVVFVQQFGRTYRAFMSAFEARVGHPLPRWRILRSLYGQPEASASQKRLIELLHVDPGALTRQLKALETLGWIARSMDARDNRITNVTLTAAGHEAVQTSLPQRNAFLHDTMAGLQDADLARVADIMKWLEVRMGEVSSAARASGPVVSAMPVDAASGTHV
ncbi:MarR family winged helix-turn-helix transcriptional regulator [Paraburkholderia hayleyella]|uniref:MarR family winged helix-turn-helix transcriptional regulator n=1 Tax=Paraburkholderia hayleyella TaxID=2152889 RepID=UPI0012910037|nr:MarR family transcriptional regulator [Paraburkholderia hayleyella]